MQPRRSKTQVRLSRLAYGSLNVGSAQRPDVTKEPCREPGCIRADAAEIRGASSEIR